MKLDEIVVFHVNHGQDMFVSLVADWVPSCFGETLDVLCKLVRPIGVSGLELCSVHNNRESELTNVNDYNVEKNDYKMSVPKELYRLIGFISEHCLNVVRLC
jgi:phosphatidylinositol-bisphosphatase